jgi:hypothetical protein
MVRQLGFGPDYIPEINAVRNPCDIPRIEAYRLTRIGRSALSIPEGTGYHRPDNWNNTAMVKRSSESLLVSVSLVPYLGSQTVQQTKVTLSWGDYDPAMPFITAERAEFDEDEHGQEVYKSHEQTYSTANAHWANTLHLYQVASAIRMAKELQLATVEGR